MKLCKLCVSVLVLVFFYSRSYSQAPSKFNYQAVVRNAAGIAITNQDVSMRFTLHSGSPTGPELYTETDTVHANSIGVIAVVVGGGAITTGNFGNINWAASGGIYMQVEVDPAGGNSFIDMGTTQLLSVPFALYAAIAGNNTPGPTGPQGPIGSQGIQGATGNQGIPGITGAQGPAGATGPQGNNGAIGTTGPQGPIGNDGAVGATGPQGPAGNDGAIGATGPQGPIGNDGAVGATGPQGPAGSDGAIGATGPQGPIGNDGAVGATGPQGPAGNDGAIGATGPQGPIGNDGAVGATGAQGPAGNDGAIGATGPQGPIGNDGAVGATGAQGPAGNNGAIGATGPQGPVGNNGAIGATGAQGATGATGAQGLQGPTGPADSIWTTVTGNNINLSAGNVGINQPNPQAALDVNGFVKLGTASPIVQMAGFTGTTPSNGGGSSTISWTIPDAKILNVNVVVHSSSAGVLSPNNSTLSEQQYSYTIQNQVFTLTTTGLSSNGILNQPFTVLVTYQQ